jgi:hypothetical protein
MKLGTTVGKVGFIDGTTVGSYEPLIVGKTVGTIVGSGEIY